jgi:TRAP-type C4-dicarboxylate transport system permease small subunit
MSGSHTVLEDGSHLSRADRLYLRLEKGFNLLGGLVIFLLVLLATGNVLGRWLFDAPISGYIDWVEQAMAFFAFLGLAYTQREGGHIRMDMLVAHLRGRWLWLTEFISTLLILLVSLVLIYGSYLHFLRAWQIGDSSLDINLPTWPAKLVVPVALSILVLRLLLQLWGYARAIHEGTDHPVAVPLIEDAAAVAAAEAESVLGSDNSNGQP